jgi:peptide/nickel transport system ATP-binding protein
MDMNSTVQQHGSSEEATSPLLQVEGLKKQFTQSSGLVTTIKQTIFDTEPSVVRAVDGVDLALRRNQVQGIIGESGCGKSTLLKVLMGLEAPSEGKITFDDTAVLDYGTREWREFRRRVQIIFQDPYNAVDPKLKVRESLREPLTIHGMDDKENRIKNALRDVQLTPPEKYLDRLPRELSGGEKQRVSIARALVLDPDLILADEPVSMLDVSTQAAILGLLNDLVNKRGLSMLYVSHDLSTVSYICDAVNVMYLGRIVESGPTEQLLTEPAHPYTQQLIKAVPIPDPHNNRDRTDLRGTPSDPTDLPTGCRFKDRCPERMDVCDHRPAFESIESDSRHAAACHLYTDSESYEGSNSGSVPYSTNGQDSTDSDRVVSGRDSR